MPRGLKRFYVDSAFPDVGALLQLSPHETFHLHRVLRLRVGDACQVFNRSEQAAEATVEAISETKGAQLRLRKFLAERTKPLFLKVAQALPQKRKMDDLVRKAEEVGVHEFWAIETERTVVKMNPEAGERARKRWERIVIEAAKQSGSSVLSRVEGPVSFKRALDEGLSPADSSFLFHPDPSGMPFTSVVDELRNVGAGLPRPGRGNRAPTSIFLFFGPEGGFTEKEVRLAESRGVKKVSLGDSTLRLETAFLGVISAIRFMVSS